MKFSSLLRTGSIDGGPIEGGRPWVLLALLALLPSALLANNALAQNDTGDYSGQKKPRGENSGFFDDSMKSGGLVQGMDLGLPKRTNDGYGDGTGNPAVGPLFGGVNGLPGESTKKNAPPALVPEVETSNGYSVPVKTPRPTPTPLPTPTPTPTPETQGIEVPGPNSPPSAEYYQRLIEQAKDPKKINPKPPAAASEKIPTPRPQSYTF